LREGVCETAFCIENELRINETRIGTMAELNCFMTHSFKRVLI